MSILDFPRWETLGSLSINRFPRISYRTSARGGAPAPSARLTPSDVLLRRDELILLVHGYKVTEEQAFNAYKCFLDKLGDPWVEMATAVFWPGDSWARKPRREEGWSYWFTSVASYPFQPKRARQVGEMLAECLSDSVDNRKRVAFAKAELLAQAEGLARPDFRDTTAPVLTLHIIAHSMGCRLAIELLHYLRHNLRSPGYQRDEVNSAVAKPIQVKLVVLMAPAVPNYLVGEVGERKAALKFAERVRVRRSTRDLVLAAAFPAGQIFESDEPRIPFSGQRSALGRTGPLTGDLTEDEGHGHGKYWTSATIPASVARDLADFHPERVAGAAQERALPAPRRSPERAVQTRSL
ncbi:alpha/beta hydrolase [Mesorhizobium sp. B2-8-9]|uniref:alpha/beta hydrolase n=1 Tax=Mesorhizobium sp. B2-8-9 TaxID=2589899 RepID=UPI0015E44A84|nr:alpha/beta hydrolase [Mesorhizobium sp. B2-8-9]